MKTDLSKLIAELEYPVERCSTGANVGGFPCGAIAAIVYLM
jgi:hypothetical protein